MRLFVAIKALGLSFDPVVELKKLKVNLSKKELEFKFVPQKNLHITLNFLGEVSLDQMDSIQKELSEASANHEPFELKLEDLKAYPEIKKGRVIWIGVQNSVKLRSLQAECETRLKNLGLEMPDRAYTPHMSVARLRSPRNLKDVLSPYQGHRFGTLRVLSVVLYESVLGGAFPIYKEVKVFDLKETAR